MLYGGKMIVTILPFLVLCLTFLACLTDLRGMKIPNIISIIGFLLFVVFIVLSVLAGKDFSLFYDNLIVGVAMFLLTFFLFAVNIFGAGDAKLATVVAFWIGLQGIAVFLFSMALSGGVLGVVALYFIKKGVPVKWQKGWLKNLADGRADVPYAIAIFFGTVASFHHIGLI